MGTIDITVTGYLFYRFISPFLQKRKYAGFAGITYSAVMLILYYIPYEMKGIFVYAAGMGAVFTTMCIAERRNAVQKVFLVITFYILDWIVGGTTILPRNFLMNEMLFQTPSIINNPNLQLLVFAAVETLHEALQIVVMVLSVRLIHGIYMDKKESMAIRELILMISPYLPVLAGYWMFSYVKSVYTLDTGKYIWTVHAEFEWFQALYQGVSFIVILTVIFVYQKIKTVNRLEKEDAVLEGQIEDIKRHIGKVERLYGDIRSLKHDMGNHLTTLEGLYRRNEAMEAGRYASRLKEQLKEMSSEIKSGNPVTDVILSEKEKEAKERGISFACSFFYPQGTRINAFDVSILLNNALENAIEAAVECEKPYITVTSYRKRNAYMIELENSSGHMAALDEENGLPLTTKAEKEGHGLGLRNIRKVAQKYNGDIDIEQKENRFILSIMLMTE